MPHYSALLEACFLLFYQIPKCLISYLQIQAASLQSLKSDLESTKKQLQQATTSKFKTFNKLPFTASLKF